MISTSKNEGYNIIIILDDLIFKEEFKDDLYS